MGFDEVSMDRFDSTDPTRFYLLNDKIALRMGRLAATRVTSDNLAQFRADIERMRRRNAGNRYFRVWQEAVESGPRAVRELLTEATERGQVLRSLISFRAFLTKDERDALFLEATRKETSVWGP